MPEALQDVQSLCVCPAVSKGGRQAGGCWRLSRSPTLLAGAPCLEEKGLTTFRRILEVAR